MKFLETPYKFTLGQDLKRDCILPVRYIYRANKTKDKTVYLELFLDSFEVVKLELRLCKDLHLTNVKQKSMLKQDQHDRTYWTVPETSVEILIEIGEKYVRIRKLCK